MQKFCQKLLSLRIDWSAEGVKLSLRNSGFKHRISASSMSVWDLGFSVTISCPQGFCSQVATLGGLPGPAQTSSQESMSLSYFSVWSVGHSDSMPLYCLWNLKCLISNSFLLRKMDWGSIHFSCKVHGSSHSEWAFLSFCLSRWQLNHKEDALSSRIGLLLLDVSNKLRDNSHWLFKISFFVWSIYFTYYFSVHWDVKSWESKVTYTSASGFWFFFFFQWTLILCGRCVGLPCMVLSYPELWLEVLDMAAPGRLLRRTVGPEFACSKVCVCEEQAWSLFSQL